MIRTTNYICEGGSLYKVDTAISDKTGERLCAVKEEPCHALAEYAFQRLTSCGGVMWRQELFFQIVKRILSRWFSAEDDESVKEEQRIFSSKVANRVLDLMSGKMCFAYTDIFMTSDGFRKIVDAVDAVRTGDGLPPKLPESWNVRAVARKNDVKSIADGWARFVRWSDEDGCYVGALPEVCGDCCDGKNIAEVLELLDEIAEGYAQDVLDGILVRKNGEWVGAVSCNGEN